jgi:hypothetical protein
LPVLDFDELFVVVVVRGAVLDDEPPGGWGLISDEIVDHSL